MATSVKQMMEAANAAVPRVMPAQAREMIAKGNTLVVDVRDAPEVDKSGKVAGAVNVSRGMLEFRADPESPYHDKNFAKDKVVIVYCASGGRSALSGKVLKDMGYGEVYNLGAFKDWAEGGARSTSRVSLAGDRRVLDRGLSCHIAPVCQRNFTTAMEGGADRSRHPGARRCEASRVGARPVQAPR
jgi:rhodanese-related sulfurtransferase